MSAKNDLRLAYTMGFEDGMAGKKPDNTKADVLAPHPWADRADEPREETTDGGAPEAPSDERITDEIREYAKGLFNTRETVLAISDRIDAAHEEAIQREHETAYDSGYDEAMKSCENWAAGHEDEMAEHGWVRGPIGADGKPMAKEHTVVDNGGNVGTIVETRFNDDNWFVLVDFGEGESARFVWFLPKSLTHHHAPTVEDVLLDMHRRLSDVSELYDVDSDELEEEYTRIIEEFAAKLRLAGSDAE